MSVYLKAAEAVVTPTTCQPGCAVCMSTLNAGIGKTWHRSCCVALSLVRASGEEVQAFHAVFNGEGRVGFWWGFPGNQRNETPRVLALLFMHWMTVDP